MRKLLLKLRFGKHVKIGLHTQISKDSTVGNHSYIGRRCLVLKTGIGRYVSIGNNVSIGNGEHSITRIATTSMFYDDPYPILTKGKCEIGSDVWIGVDAIVRRNVTVGFGAVIGANSFVNKDVPDFAIVAGSPAKILGYRFTEEQRTRILASKWWELEPDLAKKKTRELEKQWHITE